MSKPATHSSQPDHSSLSEPNPSETRSVETPFAGINPRHLAQPGDSYTKLAMRNMVRRWPTSLFHFGLTTIGIFAVLVGLAVVFH